MYCTSKSKVFQIMSKYGNQSWVIKPPGGNGHGHMKYPSGAAYVGSYKDGKEHGQGEYWHPERTYEGQ